MAWMLLLYALAWVVSWLVVRPLHVAIVHSIMDWEKAHQMVIVARERRGELARAEQFGGWQGFHVTAPVRWTVPAVARAGAR